MGTDTQIDPEMGSNAQELEIYVDYGMTPMQAIQTATKKQRGSDLGGQGRRGRSTPASLPTSLPLKAIRLKDIRILQDKEKIKIVMKAGKIYVDRRPGREKYVVQDQHWNWKRI